MGYEHASRMVIDGAALRGSNAKAGSVLAEAVKPYSSLLNIDLPYGRKRDHTLQDIPFSATSGFRTLRNTSASAVDTPRTLTIKEVIDEYPLVNEREQLVRLYKAFSDFAEVKRRLQEEHEREGGRGPRCAEIRSALPQMFEDLKE